MNVFKIPENIFIVPKIHNDKIFDTNRYELKQSYQEKLEVIRKDGKLLPLVFNFELKKSD